MKTANPTSAFSIEPPSEENTRGAHDERAYLDAGMQIFRRWHEQNERRAPLELGEMLNSQ